MKITPEPGHKVCALVYESKDYDRFEMTGFNRRLHNSKKLWWAMQEYGMLNSKPGQVIKLANGKYGIVAGHNRFSNCKRLEIPFKYVIDDVVTDIYVLEGDSKSTWRTAEFAEARSLAGDEHCLYITTFRREHQLSLSSAAALLDSTTMSKKVALEHLKDGNVVVTPESVERANRVVYITDLLYSKGVKFAVTSSFVAAVTAVVDLEAVNYSRLVEKADKHWHRLEHKTKTLECLNQLEHLYNRSVKKEDKVPIVFLVGGLNHKT